MNDKSLLPKCFACYSNKKDVLRNSSSGGVFYSLASAIVKKYKGSVYGCVINWDEVYHTRATTIDEILPMMGSKYAKSNLRHTFNECKNDLENGNFVLYSGTPCQICSLLTYLKKNGTCTEKLITVDVFCHGVPKIEYWKKYLATNYGNEKIESISFRYKQNGWENYYLKVGKHLSPKKEDPYLNAFLKNMILDHSCFNCHFKAEDRLSDISIGDFWDIDYIAPKYKNKLGTSLLVIRKKEEFILSILRKNTIINEVPYLTSIYDLNPSYYECPAHLNPIEPSLLIEKRTIIQNKKTSLKHLISRYFYKKGINRPNVYLNKRTRRLNNEIGIITDIGYSNYGNRLQNFALLETIRKFGYNPTNIIYTKQDYNFLHKIYNFLKGQNDKPSYPIKKCIYETSKQYEGRPFIFWKSRKKQKQLCKFRTILFGSDQVWNPSYHRYKADLEFLLGNFGILNAPFNLVSYGASICSNELSTSQKFLFKNSLLNFKFVSVREQQSQNLLTSIGINSSIVVDPTFLLSDTDWENAIKLYSKITVPTGRMQFNYLLGHTSMPLFKGYDFKLETTDKNSGDDLNQFDFVKYIKESELVVTDSFHAIVFCIIFRKRVFVVKRDFPGMELRIENLFSLIKTKLIWNKIYDFSKISSDSLKELISFSKDFLRMELRN